MKKITVGIIILVVIIILALVIKINFINDDVRVPAKEYGLQNLDYGYINNNEKKQKDNFVRFSKKDQKDNFVRLPKKDQKDNFVRLPKKDQKDSVKYNKNYYNTDKALKDSEKISKKMSVKIPKWSFNNKKNEWEIKWDIYKTSYSKAILFETLKKLFELRGYGKEWNGTNFNSVSLKDGNVVIKLSGKWSPSGLMSSVAFRNEIEAAVFQFSNVKSLEVLLNNEIFDWCLEDLSGIKCSNGKEPWIVKRH